MRFALPALGLVMLSGTFAIAHPDSDGKDRKDRKVIVKTFTAGGGRLGVEITDLTPSLRKHFGAKADAGVLVGEVEADSPASRAGLKVGDVVVSVDGDEVESAFDVIRAMSDRDAGHTVAIEILRDKKRMTLSAKVEARKKGDVERLERFGARDFDFDFDFDTPDVQVIPDFDDDGVKVRPRVKVFRYPDADADDQKVIDRLEKLERSLQKLEESSK